MSDARPIEIWTLIFSVLATVIPLALYWWSQKREVTITGEIISGPANKSINGYQVQLVFKAQNTGKKIIYVNDFKGIFAQGQEVIQRPIYKYPLTLQEDEVHEISIIVNTRNLKIEKVALTDSINKEWLLPQSVLKKIETDVNIRIANIEEDELNQNKGKQ